MRFDPHGVSRTEVENSPTVSPYSLATRIARQFEARFDHPPQWLAAAPGRVNLIGEHTDYNDGLVFPMAIERCTVIAAASNGTSQIKLESTATHGTATLDLGLPIKRGEPMWANYPRGVIAGFQRLGIEITGFNALIDSTIPLGGGLSSSAALEIAMATLLEGITGHTLDLVQKALLCQQAEEEFAGVPCGIMDQFTSVMAEENHLLLLDCRSLKTEMVPWSDPSLAVLIINTNVRHELSGGEYATRRDQCETAARALNVSSLRDATLAQLEAARGQLDSVVFRRARHVITEIQRPGETAQAMRAGRWDRVGELMYASHASLRDDFEVSCPELDLVVELAHGLGERFGVIGCRMTGGGFGGCAVTVVRTDAVSDISRMLAEEYRAKIGLEPTLFVSRPAVGTRLLKLIPQ